MASGLGAGAQGSIGGVVGCVGFAAYELARRNEREV